MIRTWFSLLGIIFLCVESHALGLRPQPACVADGAAVVCAADGMPPAFLVFSRDESAQPAGAGVPNEELPYPAAVCTVTPHAARCARLPAAGSAVSLISRYKKSVIGIQTVI